MLGSATGEDFRSATAALLEDDATDALIILFVPTADLPTDDVAAAIAEAVERAAARKPVLACLLAEGGAPPAPARSAASVAFPASPSRARTRPASPPPAASRPGRTPTPHRPPGRPAGPPPTPRRGRPPPASAAPRRRPTAR